MTDARPVFAAATMRDGKALVLVGISEDTWRHMRTGKAVRVGDADMPVRLIMLAAADQAQCKTALDAIIGVPQFWNQLHEQFGVK